MHRHAFTLVELLMVVAIIAILAAMLFPAIRTVQNAAGGSVCASNQRQIVAALHHYAQEWNDVLPWSLLSNTDPKPPEITRYFSGTGAATFWHTPILGQYLGIEMYTVNTYAPKGSVKVMHCPLDRQSCSFAGMDVATIPQNQSYGLNRWLCPRKPQGAWTIGATTIHGFRRVSAVKLAGIVPVVTDCAGDQGWMSGWATTKPDCMPYSDLEYQNTWAVWPSDATLEPWLQVPRHGGQAIAGFLDGSARRVNLPVASANDTIRAGRP